MRAPALKMPRRRLAGDDLAEEIDTVGGLIASIAGHVPVRGEIVVDPGRGLEYEILDADPRRVKRIKLHLRDADKTAEARETSAAEIEK